MVIRLPSILHAKQILRRSVLFPKYSDVPKGCLAVYVGESQKRRFVIPISYLEQPPFRELLIKSEEEFGFSHPNGGLTIPCREEIFTDLISFMDGL